MAEIISLNASTENLDRLFWKEWDIQTTQNPSRPSLHSSTSSLKKSNNDVVVIYPKCSVSFTEVMDEELAKNLQDQEQEDAMTSYFTEVEDLELALSLSASLQELKHEFQNFGPMMEEEELGEPSFNEFEQFINLRNRILEEINDEEEYKEESKNWFDDMITLPYDEVEVYPKRTEKIYKRKYANFHNSVKHIYCTKQLIEESIPVPPRPLEIGGISPFSPEIMERYNLKDEESQKVGTETKQESKSIQKTKIRNTRKNRKTLGSFDEDESETRQTAEKAKKIDASFCTEGFDYFRWVFWTKYHEEILDALGSQYSVTKLELLNINNQVSNRFINKLRENKKPPALCYHGTDSKNYNSICEKGLLVPGQQGVSVRNGSAFGVGIYTSRTASYSVGYARGDNSLMVCAVIDDSQETRPSSSHSIPKTKKPVTPNHPDPSNRFHKHHQKPSGKTSKGSIQKIVNKGPWKYIASKDGKSRSVSCHGNIVVLFDPAHVCPLFRLSYSNSPTTSIVSVLSSSLSANCAAALAKKAKNLKHKYSKKQNQRQFIESSSSLLFTCHRRNPTFWN